MTQFLVVSFKSRGYHIFTWLLASTIFISCRHENVDIQISKYASGNIEFLKKYENKKLHGESVWFYPDGTLEAKVSYKNGTEDGHAYYFYRSGALKSHRYWKDGHMEGFLVDYWDGHYGILQATLYYNQNGELIYKKTFDSTGKFISEEGHKPQ